MSVESSNEFPQVESFLSNGDERDAIKVHYETFRFMNSTLSDGLAEFASVRKISMVCKCWGRMGESQDVFQYPQICIYMRIKLRETLGSFNFEKVVEKKRIVKNCTVERDRADDCIALIEYETRGDLWIAILSRIHRIEISVSCSLARAANSRSVRNVSRAELPRRP